MRHSLISSCVWSTYTYNHGCLQHTSGIAGRHAWKKTEGSPPRLKKIIRVSPCYASSDHESCLSFMSLNELHTATVYEQAQIWQKGLSRIDIKLSPLICCSCLLCKTSLLALLHSFFCNLSLARRNSGTLITLVTLQLDLTCEETALAEAEIVAICCGRKPRCDDPGHYWLRTMVVTSFRCVHSPSQVPSAALGRSNIRIWCWPWLTSIHSWQLWLVVQVYEPVHVQRWDQLALPLPDYTNIVFFQVRCASSSGGKTLDIARCSCTLAHCKALRSLKALHQCSWSWVFCARHLCCVLLWGLFEQFRLYSRLVADITEPQTSIFLVQLQ